MSYLAHVEGSLAINPPLIWAEIRSSRFFDQNQKERSDQTDVVLLVNSTEVETDRGIDTILACNTAIPCRESFDCRDLRAQTESLVQAMQEIGRTVRGEMLVQPHDYGDGGIWRVVVDEKGVKKEMAQLVWPDGTPVQLP